MNPFLLRIQVPRGKERRKRGKYCQYRTIKRSPVYIFRLVERAFCLDANVLARSGFFRGGRGAKWDYECRSKKESYLGGAYLTLIDSDERGEHNILVDNAGLCGKQEIRIKREQHSFIRHRYWFTCPKCSKRVTTLFIPIGAERLACRRCHKLYYWSQMKSKGRIGEEDYKEQQELYIVHKSAVRENGENTEDRRS